MPRWKKKLSNQTTQTGRRRFVMGGAAVALAGRALPSANAAQLPLAANETLRPLRVGELLIDDSDGSLAWRDRVGTLRRIREVSTVKTPYDFGAKGGGSVDDTRALQRFADAGGGMIPPDTFRVTATIILPSGTSITGHGDSSIIKLGLPPGAPVLPLMVSKRNSSDVHLEKIYLDHNASRLVTPAIGKGNVLFGSCLMLMSSSSSLNQMTVANGWDNCIVVCDANYPEDGNGTGGKPKYIEINEVTTLNAGCGWHASGALRGHTGTGINIASAQFVTIDSCIDRDSYGAFGTDTGGIAAFVTFENCISYNCKLDSSNPNNGSGNAFVHQTSQCKLISCSAYSPGNRGFWISAGPTPLVGIILSGCFCDRAGGNGFEISSSNVVVDGCYSHNSSQRQAGRFSEFAVTSIFSTIANTTFANCHGISDDGKARFAYNEIPNDNTDKSYSITTSITGGVFKCSSANAINTGPATVIIGEENGNVRLRSAQDRAISLGNPVRFPSYSWRQLTISTGADYLDPSLYSGCVVAVTDREGRLARSNGERWRQLEDHDSKPW